MMLRLVTSTTVCPIQETIQTISEHLLKLDPPEWHWLPAHRLRTQPLLPRIAMSPYKLCCRTTDIGAGTWSSPPYKRRMSMLARGICSPTQNTLRVSQRTLLQQHSVFTQLVLYEFFRSRIFG